MHHQYRTVEDLLADETFINYCLHKNEADVRLWEAFIAAHPENKELVAAAAQEYRLLFSTLARTDMEEQLVRLKKKLEGAEAAPVVELQPANRAPARMYWRLGSVTAAALAIISAGLYLVLSVQREPVVQQAAIQYTSKPGERKSFQLPDGTQVALNAGSEILLNANYAKNTREVYLRGEAFFDVQHNAAVPFIVHTVSMDVKALGTAFNVKSYKGENKTEAILLRGLVEVTLKKDNNRKLLLHPDEKVLWAEGGNTATASTTTTTKDHELALVKPVHKFDNGGVKELAWVQNSLAFEDEVFEDVALQLNRWYNVNIRFETNDVKRYHFTATFKQEKIEQVLNILKTSKPFNYRFEGEHDIVIYK